MDGGGIERVKAVKWRTRTAASASNTTSIQDTIRSKCMEVTMSMMRRLHPVSDPSTYADVTRGMLLIAISSPLKCMCVGISPYESGILSPFATALAYSPKKCIGATPSVQVMSQIMSLCAIEMKDAYTNKKKNAVVIPYPTRDEYTSRFAMMLRCSYSCVEAGVAFVNSSPVITDMTSKACFSRSLFSEWIANVVTIHIEYGYKITVVSMGASADKTIHRATGSYPDVSSSMILVKTMNPAAIARMNVSKSVTESMIPNESTPGEMFIDSIVGTNTSLDPKTGFHWNRYQDATLRTFIGTDAIRSIVTRLVDHAPDRLLNLTASSIQNLYAIMSDYDIESMIQSAGVNEGAIANADQTGDTNTNFNTYHQATMSTANDAQASVVINPFEQAHAESSGAQNTYQSGGGNQGGQQGGYQGGNRSEGPNMFTKRSQLGQMLDPTGKAVSQQSIVIDSINRQGDQILMASKQICNDTVELTRRQAVVMDMMTKFESVDKDMIEDAKNFVEEYTEHIKTIFEHMEESRGVIEALHAVVEGDRGIYEAEATPVAPLLRRDDGTTMKQFVYGQTTRMGQMSQSANQFQAAEPQVNTGTNQATKSVNPFITGESEAETTGTNSNMSLFQTGDPTYIGIADKIIKTTLKETDFGSDTTYKTVYTSVLKYKMEVAGMSTTMYEVMKRIVSQKITLNGGTNPSDGEMGALIACLGSGSDEDLDGCEEPFADAVMNDSAVMSLFTTLMTYDTEEETETEDESEDEDGIMSGTE